MKQCNHCEEPLENNHEICPCCGTTQDIKEWDEERIQIIEELKSLKPEPLSYDSIISDLKNDSTLVVAADRVCVELSKPLARKIYALAIEKTKNISIGWHLIQSISCDGYLGDKNWGKEVCLDVLEKVTESMDYTDIADIIADKDFLDDKAWARTVYEQAEESAKDFQDILYLSESVANESYLGDAEWGNALFEKSTAAIKQPGEYWYLAESILSGRSNQSWEKAIAFLRKGILEADEMEEMVRILEPLCREKYFENRDLEIELINMALDKAICSYDYVLIASIVADEKALGDKEWGKELFKKALSESAVQHDTDYCMRAIQTYYDDWE